MVAYVQGHSYVCMQAYMRNLRVRKGLEVADQLYVASALGVEILYTQTNRHPHTQTQTQTHTHTQTGIISSSFTITP